MGKLIDLLDALEFNQVAIFTNSSERAVATCEALQNASFPCQVITEKNTKEERVQLYQEFRAFRSRILVATDAFCRGLDFGQLSIVINYDMPESVQEYIHRAGRTGRFGRRGMCLSLVASDKEDPNELCDHYRSLWDVNILPLPSRVNSDVYMNGGL